MNENQNNLEYKIIYDILPDCLYIELIRTYHRDQFQKVMKLLCQIAKINDKTILRGEVLGAARLRLFIRHGWSSTGKTRLRDDGIITEIEFLCANLILLE